MHRRMRTKPPDLRRRFERHAEQASGVGSHFANIYIYIYLRNTNTEESEDATKLPDIYYKISVYLNWKTLRLQPTHSYEQLPSTSHWDPLIVADGEDLSRCRSCGGHWVATIGAEPRLYARNFPQIYTRRIDLVFARETRLYTRLPRLYTRLTRLKK